MGRDRCGYAEGAVFVSDGDVGQLSIGSGGDGSGIRERAQSSRRRVSLTTSMATIRAFEPKFMKVGVLSAALQELTPRDVRDADPDRAIEDWIAYAKELGADELQLSAALHPSEADVPPEAMLDPVANTLDLRKPFDGQRAKRVQSALKSAGIGLSDVAYFDNLLHHDASLRKKKHEFLRRVLDAAQALGVRAV